MLNREKLIWGLILIGIGGLFLLDNLGFIEFYWGSIWRMWPIVLVIIGINLILPKNRMGNILTVIMIVAVFVFLWMFTLTKNRISEGEVSQRIGNTERSSKNAITGMMRQTFIQEYKDSLKSVDLKIKGGAITYKILEPNSDQLFFARAESDFGSHTKHYKASDGEGYISFEMNTANKKDFNIDASRNFVEFNLHPQPIWNLDLDFGAGAADFDLTGYKIQKLDVDCGAASFKAKMGAPLSASKINIDSGAGAVKLQIPEGVACSIRVKTGLSSREFPGFEKVGDNLFQTPGFLESTPHYAIELKGGLSSFRVELIKNNSF